MSTTDVQMAPNHLGVTAKALGGEQIIVPANQEAETVRLLDT